jgi:diazepam-binding inhibitor (GABA receptor modulating acyl-CoA-binding protein)
VPWQASLRVVAWPRRPFCQITPLQTMSTEERFAKALKFIQSLPKDAPNKPSNTQLLQFYALFKQISDGKCTTKAPSRMKMIEHAKWSAWNALGSISKEEAQKKCVSIPCTRYFSAASMTMIESVPHTCPRPRYIAEITKLEPKWEELAKAKL